MDDTGGSPKPSPHLQNTYRDSASTGTGSDEQIGAMTGAETSDEAELGGSDSEETLDMTGSTYVQLDETSSLPDSIDTSSSLVLSDVPIKYSLHPPGLLKEIKDDVSIYNQEASIVQARRENQLQSADDPSKLELSPTSVTQSILSIPSPTPGERRLLSPREIRNSMCMQEVDNRKSSSSKVLSCTPVLKLKIQAPDGYNWRKYGQKQVKSPQGSRSYYRCTYSDCGAKKIECSDHTNRVTEIVYRSPHNHEPPRNVNTPLTFSPTPLSQDNTLGRPDSNSDEAVQSTSKKHLQEPTPIAELKLQESSGLDGNAETNVKWEDHDEAAQKKRLKKISPNCSETLPKPDKKAKLVVHAAGDVGISSDGYRWRKYGQKMVKGNPHPRNYYRCTSAGCPVRKHIERAVDNTTALIITYKGVHDHGMPVPKKRYGQPSAPPLVASTANLQSEKSEPTTQWSVDKEGALTGEKLECEGEKTTESAKTLLSIGFEIKPC